MVRHTVQGEQFDMNGCGRDGGMKTRRKSKSGRRRGKRGNGERKTKRERQGKKDDKCGVGGSDPGKIGKIDSVFLMVMQNFGVG